MNQIVMHLSPRISAIEQDVKHILELLERGCKWEKPLLSFAEGAEILHVTEQRLRDIVHKFHTDYGEDPPFLARNGTTRMLIIRDKLIEFATTRKKKRRKKSWINNSGIKTGQA